MLFDRLRIHEPITTSTEQIIDEVFSDLQELAQSRLS